MGYFHDGKNIITLNILTNIFTKKWEKVLDLEETDDGIVYAELGTFYLDGGSIKTGEEFLEGGILSVYWGTLKFYLISWMVTVEAQTFLK